MKDDDSANISWKSNLPLDHPDVAERLKEVFESDYLTITLHESCRWGRRFLRPHRTRDGRLYVRGGRKGGCKRFIDRCDITYIDGRAKIFSFKVEKHDWEIREEKDAMRGWQ